MLPLSALEFVGGAIFTSNGAAAPTAIARSNASLATGAGGAGDVLINLGDGGVDRTQCIAFISSADPTSNLGIQLLHVTDAQKRISTFDDAGAAVDATSSAFFFRLTGVAKLDKGSQAVGSLPAGAALQYVGHVLLTTNGAGAPVIASQVNVTIPALGTGTGDITVVLGDGGIDANECIMAIWNENATALTARVAHTSDTQKQILVFNDLAVAADGVVGVAFFKVNAPGIFT